MSTEFARNYFESLMREDDIYFAGIFDGEGCVTIDKVMKNSGSVTPVYHLSVQIAMVDRRPLDDILKVYGLGGIYKASFGKIALAPAWRWCAVCRQAAEFLRHIQPYCRVKESEVNIAITFQEHVDSNIGYHKRLHEDVLRIREGWRVELQTLKRRFRTRSTHQ